MARAIRHEMEVDRQELEPSKHAPDIQPGGITQEFPSLTATGPVMLAKRPVIGPAVLEQRKRRGKIRRLRRHQRNQRQEVRSWRLRNQRQRNQRESRKRRRRRRVNRDWQHHHHQRNNPSKDNNNKGINRN